MKTNKKPPFLKLRKANQSGSLSLEQALFIGAIVGMFGAIFTFYDKLGGYFSNITFDNLPTSVSSTNNNG